MGSWPCFNVSPGYRVGRWSDQPPGRSASDRGFNSSQGVEATHGALGEALDGPGALKALSSRCWRCGCQTLTRECWDASCRVGSSPTQSMKGIKPGW